MNFPVAAALSLSAVVCCVAPACSGASDQADPLADAGMHDAGEEGSDGSAALPPIARPDSGNEPTDAGLRVGCHSNAECGAGSDAAASALCSMGYCICPAGQYVQSDGHCGATIPPACAEQGGTCSEQCVYYAGTSTASESCGDFVPDTCCFEHCEGEGVVNGCSSDAGSGSPVSCVNGWLTCDPGSHLTFMAL